MFQGRALWHASAVQWDKRGAKIHRDNWTDQARNKLRMLALRTLKGVGETGHDVHDDTPGYGYHVRRPLSVREELTLKDTRYEAARGQLILTT